MTPHPLLRRMNPLRMRPALRPGLRKVEDAGASATTRPVPDWLWRELEEVG